LLGINRPDAFILLIKLLASQTGQIINHANLAKEGGLSFETLKKYLWYAEKTFSVKMVAPFFRNKRKEITKAASVYFYDLGLRNFALDLMGKLNKPEELGFIFQNFVANILLEKISGTSKVLNFWRTIGQAEVDFVLDGGESVIPIEVKYSHFQTPKITRSMRSFLEKYNPKEAWVINLTLDEEILVGETTVKFIPFYKIF